MISSSKPISDGVAGISEIVRTLNAIKDHYGALPCIRAAALAVCGSTIDHDQAGHLARLASFVRGAIVYVCDPRDAEFVQTPDVLLLEINRRGYAQGDCDDHCALFAALAQSIGIACEVVGVCSEPGITVPDHVICLAQLDAGPVDIDLVAKGGETPVYTDYLFSR